VCDTSLGSNNVRGGGVLIFQFYGTSFTRKRNGELGHFSQTTFKEREHGDLDKVLHFSLYNFLQQKANKSFPAYKQNSQPFYHTTTSVKEGGSNKIVQILKHFITVSQRGGGASPEHSFYGIFHNR
jgi:hypothetical protein